MRERIDSDDGSEGGGFQDSGSFRSSAASHSNRDGNSKSNDGDATGADDGEGVYDDDDFDDYESDSFEAEDDDTKDADTDPERDAGPSAAWSTGDRVQVFWPDEGAWLDGVVSDCSGHEFQIQYDDGDVTWESGDGIRPHPSAFGIARYESLPSRLLSSSSVAESEVKSVQGRAVAVCWTSEAAWFCGRVSAFELNPSALLVEYDDGDTRWQHGSELRQMILLPEDGDNQEPIVTSTPDSSSLRAPLPAPAERVLYPRAYNTVVGDHFQSVRLARADRYVSCVARHIGSVVAPRANYTARVYLHSVRLECDTLGSGQQSLMSTSDSATQTLIDLDGGGSSSPAVA